MKVEPGLRIRFYEEKVAYTVQASDSRFAICTKPFRLKKTVLYTIIDWDDNIRGTENLVFGLGAESRRQCLRMLQRLRKGESEVSHRNRVGLRIKDILKPKGKKR